MLTRAAPAINRALGNVFGQDQLAQFMSAVGQCAQPLEHRAPVAFSNGQNGLDGRNGHDGRDGPGGPPGQGWNPEDYPDLFPSVTNNTFVDISNSSNYRGGDWISNYYAGPNVDLRQILNQTMNQYLAQNHYAGDTINIAGNTNTTNLTTNNITTENINTTNINNFPTAPGPSGPQGDRGLDGRAGAPGQAGAPGRDGAVVVIGNQFDPSEIIRQIRNLQAFVKDLRDDIDALVVKLGNIQATPAQIKFDPDTCKLVPETVNIQVTVPGL